MVEDYMDYIQHIKTGNGPLIFILVLVAFVCFIMYYDLPSTYTKLEESIGGFMNRRLVKFEIEKTTLHVATGKGKIYFNKQYLKLHLDQNQDQNQN